MKQHITPEQLLALEDKQMIKLLEWWEPQEGNIVYWDLTESYYVVLGCRDKYSYLVRDYASYKCDEEATTYKKYIKEGWSLKDDLDGREYWHILLPLLSIGQMIEILEERSSIFNIVRYDDCNGKLWNVRGTLFGRKHYEALKPELCDALWEVVKAIL